MNRTALAVIAVLASLLVVALIALLIAVHSGPADAPLATARPPRAAAGEATRVAAPAPVTEPTEPPPAPAEPLHGADTVPPEPPPGPHPNAEAKERGPARIERAKLIAALRDSGPASEPWAGRGTALLEEISKRAAGMTPEGCYVAGCASTYVFASQSDYEKALRAVMDLSDFRGWTGGKKWTTAELAPDGRVLVALLLYRPD